jgi:hypothetical protein
MDQEFLRTLHVCELRNDARQQSESTHADADGYRELVWAKALGALLGGGRRVATHASITLVVAGAKNPTRQRVMALKDVKSAVVGAVKFAYSGGQSLEQLARDRWDVFNGTLEGTLGNNE